MFDQKMTVLAVLFKSWKSILEFTVRHKDISPFDCPFTLIAKILIAKWPIAKGSIDESPIAEIPIAECPIAKSLIAECPIA